MAGIVTIVELTPDMVTPLGRVFGFSVTVNVSSSSKMSSLVAVTAEHSSCVLESDAGNVSLSGAKLKSLEEAVYRELLCSSKIMINIYQFPWC